MRDIAQRDLSARARENLELDALLHPARAFAHPKDVVRATSLSLNEKRAILASWASDACAVEAAPELRCLESGRIVRWDDVMDALRLLDKQAAEASRARREDGDDESAQGLPRSPWLALCS